MLAEELLSVIEKILQDYDRFKVDETFINAVNAATNRQADRNSYNAQAVSVRKVAEQMLQSSAFAGLPRDVKDLVNLSEYGSSSPERLAKLFLHALPPNPAAAISSNEIDADRKLFTAFFETLTTTARLARGFGIEPMRPKLDFAFRLRFGEGIAESRLEKISQLTRRWSQALDLLGRVRLEKSIEINVDYVSSSDPTYWLSSVIEYAPVLLEFYSNVVDAAKKTLEFREVWKEMRSFRVRDGEDDAESYHEHIIQSVIRGLARSEKPGEDAASGREALAGLQASAKLLVEDVQKGTRIYFEIDTRIDSKLREAVGIDMDKLLELKRKCEELEVKIGDMQMKRELLSAPQN